MTALFTTSTLLAGCEINSIEPGNTTPTSITKNPNVIEATWTINTTTGTDKKTSEIKTLIETRKKELETETGNKKELNEKDIQLLESVLNAMTKKK